MFPCIMYQKDYILRMIELLGDLIRAIFGWIARGNFAQAEQKISEAYLTFLRKDASFFNRIPEDELTTTLMADHNYTHGHLEILAELMHAQAFLTYTRGDRLESLVYYRKSLKLFEFVEEKDKTYSPDRVEKMEKIKTLIRDLQEPK